MKKNKLSLVSLIFLLCTVLFAEEDSAFLISPFAGIRWGSQDEFVYASAANGKEYKLSELNWEQKPMLLFGFNAQFNKNRFHISLTTETSPHTKTGKVIDKDWMNVSNSYCTNEDAYLIQTNLSETKNYLEKYFRAEGGISFDAVKNEKVIFSPSVKFEYEYSRFVTRNGWYQYAATPAAGADYKSYTTGAKKNLGSEDAMRLERQIFCTWLGFNTAISFNQKINLEVLTEICPYIFVFSKDFHIMRNDDFLDMMNAELSGIKISAKINYSFSKNHSVFLKTEYKTLSGIDGESYSKKSSEKKYYKISSTSGSAFENFSFYAGYIFKF